jgi:L,D-peptidoglycan transpeptidase YkuD (ErfK/YbiS/YcfS/YnhG family)
MTARLSAEVRGDATLAWRGRRLRCALGRSGIAATKREGDGCTPAGILPLRRLLYRADRLAPPPGSLPREPIGTADGWCDDPAHADYNRAVTLPHPGSCEQLSRNDHLYDLVAVLGWNDAPVVAGRGSAIFLHVAREDYAPTAGCVALALPDLLALLAEGMTSLHVKND